MQALLKSSPSSCFPDRCDSIIGGKYMIKHIMFEEICFRSLRGLQDNYLSALEWWEGSFYDCITTPMADWPPLPLFISRLSHLVFPNISQNEPETSRSSKTYVQQADYIYIRARLRSSSLWPAPSFLRGATKIHIQRSPVSTSPALQICQDRNDREPLSHPAPTQESAKLRGVFVNLAACARQKQNSSQRECHDDKWWNER